MDLCHRVRAMAEPTLAQAKTGEFFKLEEGEVIELKADQSLMRTTR